MQLNEAGFFTIKTPCIFLHKKCDILQGIVEGFMQLW